MSFTLKILIGLFLGIFTGVFLGEIAAPFSIAGEVFIGLLQMTVLPYIVVSLIGNLGAISWMERRSLLVSGIAVLSVMLLLGLAVLLVIPLAFPSVKSASFFSSSLIETPKVFDLVELYIPANPFASLANNVVPAAVLFSILVGIGIGGIPGKEGLLRALDVFADGLNVINKMIIKLTPAGVFAIAAGTAGTISLTEVDKLQAYLITYTLIALTLSFVVLPLLVTSVTPFRYPDYSIVVPHGTNAKVPLGYPLPKGDDEWSGFISTWVELEKKSGSVDLLFDHWIRGGGAKSTEPRWSIIRDVLHWVE